MRLQEWHLSCNMTRAVLARASSRAPKTSIRAVVSLCDLCLSHHLPRPQRSDESLVTIEATLLTGSRRRSQKTPIRAPNLSTTRMRTSQFGFTFIMLAPTHTRLPSLHQTCKSCKSPQLVTSELYRNSQILEAMTSLCHLRRPQWSDSQAAGN